MEGEAFFLSASPSVLACLALTWPLFPPEGFQGRRRGKNSRSFFHLPTSLFRGWQGEEATQIAVWIKVGDILRGLLGGQTLHLKTGGLLCRLNVCNDLSLYSFYRVNEVQRFEYSRPIRKGEKNPDNEFAVKNNPKSPQADSTLNRTACGSMASKATPVQPGVSVH